MVHVLHNVISHASLRTMENFVKNPLSFFGLRLRSVYLLRKLFLLQLPGLYDFYGFLAQVTTSSHK